MSDSDDSEYNVEDFIIPDTVRHTYNNEDVLSNDEQGSNSSDSETEDNVEPDQEILNPQCKLSNGNGKKTESDDEQSEDEPVRANKRYILYVTNLATETTKTMLEDFFNDAGLVRSIRIPKVRLGCYAFVEMADFDGFKKGLKFNNKELDGRKIQVYEGSKNKKHSSTKAKNLKRKTQQQHLSNMKLKQKKLNE